MSKNDVLDKGIAHRFAWRAEASADFLKQLDPKPTAAPPRASSAPAPQSAATAAASAAATTPKEQPSSEERESRERGARERDELARQIMRAWELTPPARQAAATAALLPRVERLVLMIAGMGGHPLESVLLWRLIVRHYDRLPAGQRKSAVHTLTFMPVPAARREVADLLVEAAAKGDRFLAFILEQGGAATDAVGRKHPELGRRLARILDESPDWNAREIAATWLSLGEFREAIPALRRALFQPHARIRWIALEILLQHDAPSVTEAEVLWLLEDAVKHPLSNSFEERIYDTACGYSDVLVKAVAKLRPAGGFRPLEIIAEHGGELIQGERGGVDAGWAMRALAAGYPERALARIDRLLYAKKSHGTAPAVDASALLPDDEQARPRLLYAASGPHNFIAERAKEAWFKRFGEACPLSPLSGVEAGLLAGEPSEQLLTRLLVLRGASEEAKVSMIEALLAEAPEEAPAEGITAAQRELLVLLLFTVDEWRARHASFPYAEKDWAALFMKRFGEPGFEGVLSLAGRGARAGVDHEWLTGLAWLAREGALSEAQRDKLRAVAAEALRSPAWGGSTAPLITLLNVGPPPDLLDELWSVAIAKPDDETKPFVFSYAVQWAADVLAIMKDAPALDARIAEEGPALLRARAYDPLDDLVRLGCRRRVPAAFDLAEQIIEAFDTDSAARDAALHVGYALSEAGRASDAWVLDLLKSPEVPRFAVGAHLCRKRTEPEILAALTSALSSPARSGASAADAAATLVAMKALPWDDARLDGILDRAPPREREELLSAMLFAEAPISLVRRHALDLLVCEDEKAAGLVIDDLLMRESDESTEVFQAALRLRPTPYIEGALKDHLGEPGEAELYWRDGGDDDDEEEDDEEGVLGD